MLVSRAHNCHIKNKQRLHGDISQKRITVTDCRLQYAITLKVVPLPTMHARTAQGAKCEYRGYDSECADSDSVTCAYSYSSFPIVVILFFTMAKLGLVDLIHKVQVDIRYRPLPESIPF